MAKFTSIDLSAHVAPSGVDEASAWHPGIVEPLETLPARRAPGRLGAGLRGRLGTPPDGVCAPVLVELPLQVGMCPILLGIGKDLLGWAVLDHLTHVHKDHIVSQTPCLAQNMGHQYDGIIRLERQQPIFDAPRRDRIER
jgi:hypothetical protein